MLTSIELIGNKLYVRLSCLLKSGIQGTTQAFEWAPEDSEARFQAFPASELLWTSDRDRK